MSIHSLLFLVLLEGVAASSNPRFETYGEMNSAGYYFSPGFDCQAIVNEREVVFTATKNETQWAVFSMTKVSLETSISGYVVTKLLEDQVEGESVRCTVKHGHNNEQSKDLVIIDRLYGGDLDSANHLTIVVGRHDGGDLEVVSCGWGYAPGRTFWRGSGLVVMYTEKSGKQVQAVNRFNKPVGCDDVTSETGH